MIERSVSDHPTVEFMKPAARESDLDHNPRSQQR